jgi:choline dehydrogenase-like flavoprotein
MTVRIMVIHTPAHHADPTLPPLQAPQKHCNDTVSYWPRYDSTVHASRHKRLMIEHRGKGLGGSSGINFYVFTQPPASDIDGTPCSLWFITYYELRFCAIAIEKLGNPGWNWETYIRYSRKSERYGDSRTSSGPRLILMNYDAGLLRLVRKRRRQSGCTLIQRITE